MMDQQVVDAIVERCRNLSLIYGGQSDTLSEVRKYYAMFHRCPEAGAYVMLDEALKKVEQNDLD